MVDFCSVSKQSLVNNLSGIDRFLPKNKEQLINECELAYTGLNIKNNGTANQLSAFLDFLEKSGCNNVSISSCKNQAIRALKNTAPGPKTILSKKYLPFSGKYATFTAIDSGNLLSIRLRVDVARGPDFKLTLASDHLYKININTGRITNEKGALPHSFQAKQEIIDELILIFNEAIALKETPASEQKAYNSIVKRLELIRDK